MSVFPANIDLSTLNGSDGFKLSGAAAYDFSASVASAGDVNGDGFGDLIVGACGADPHGSESGVSYVVFGKAGGFGSNLDLSSLDGLTGFRLSGAAANDRAGYSVASAGDVNGDGFADVIIGALAADPKASGFPFNIDVSSLDGDTGFRIQTPGGYAGTSVASAGDVNGDGFDDLIVGARGADPNGTSSGASFVIFGKASGFAANLDVSGLNGSNGFELDGPIAQGQAGFSVAAAGDVNGDGLDDLIVGGPYGSGGGAGYVVFGRAPTTPVVRVGSDLAQALSGGSARDVLIGQGGDDRLFGNGSSDTLDGGAGDDELHGGTGSDAMIGGEGDDTYYVDSGDDVATEYAGEGTDTVHTTASFTLGQHVENLIASSDAGLILRGNSLANTVTGGGGNDTLVGGYGNDTLEGGGGNDTLNGGGGADAMDGGAGDDRYFIDDAGDTVTDSSGTDSIYTTIDYALGAGFERLHARSNAGLILTGNGVDNVIVGGGGDDTITGGGGRDVMSGGAGGDTFVLQALSDSVASGLRDVIRDFQIGADKIDLTAIDADAALAGDQAFSFIGAGAFTHTAGELQAKAFGVNTLVSGDVDGNGSADFQILLGGSVALQATDFLL